MIPKHAPTPGPWAYSVHDTSAGLVWKIGPFNACIYVDMRGGVSNENLSPFEAAANSRLIAAAPDLLEALRTLLPMVEEWHAEFPRDVGDKEAPAIAAAHAAIAKAEGRS